jgi:hypothetical protein
MDKKFGPKMQAKRPFRRPMLSWKSAVNMCCKEMEREDGLIWLTLRPVMGSVKCMGFVD